jgi:hypothetical protein
MDSTVPAFPPRSDADPAVPIIDARPILRRTDDNLWDRTERLRSQLYHLIEDTCLKLGFEALVLQSDPYVHPAWVKVESWKPERGGALTARSSMTVTITAMPYHLYEAVYKVEWEKQDRRGVKDHLYAFREHEVRQMLRVLLTGPGLPPFGDGEVKWILGSVQLRTEWWHIWKPRNKVVALRPDYVRAGSAVLLAAGGIMTLGGLAAQSGGLDDGAYDPGMYEDTTAVVAPTTDTVMAAPYTDTTAAVVPTTDSVVTTVSVPIDTVMGLWLGPGQEFTGQLDANDGAFSNTGARYEDWSYNGRAGEHIAVVMRSGSFVPVVTVGQYVDGRWIELARPPSPPGGTESWVELVIPADGMYVVTAAATASDAAGGYTLRLDPVGGTP